MILFFSLEPSLPPRNIVTDVLNATTVVMSWMPPLQEGQNGFIQSYNVRVIGVHSRENYSIAISSTEIFINNLHPFYSYMFSVAAETISQGPFSEAVTIAMPTSGKVHGGQLHTHKISFSTPIPTKHS